MDGRSTLLLCLSIFLCADICMLFSGQPSNSNLDMRSSPLFRGLSWGAGAIVLLGAAWAIVQNAGYAPLLKVRTHSSTITCFLSTLYMNHHQAQSTAS